MVQFFYPNVSHQCFFCRIFLLPLVRVVTSFTVDMFFDIWYTLDLGCCRHVKSIVYLHGWIVISEDFVDPKFESTCRWLFPNILLCSPGLLGEMIQFDKQIFSGWVGEKPPTSNDWIYCEWLFLVPLIGGKVGSVPYNPPIGSIYHVYTTYIPRIYHLYIYIANWVIIWYLPTTY